MSREEFSHSRSARPSSQKLQAESLTEGRCNRSHHDLWLKARDFVITSWQEKELLRSSNMSPACLVRLPCHLATHAGLGSRRAGNLHTDLRQSSSGEVSSLQVSPLIHMFMMILIFGPCIESVKLSGLTDWSAAASEWLAVVSLGTGPKAPKSVRHCILYKYIGLI